MARPITQECIDFVKAWEGYSDVPYGDIGGFPTIGYGHYIRKAESFTIIDKAQAEKLLAQDLLRAAKSVLSLVKTTLTDNQYTALIDFTFNLGGAALQRSTLLHKINRGESPKGEWIKWIYVGGKKSKGLLNRRLSESNLFSDG